MTESSFRTRIRRRGKFVLAGIAFTGCATAVSGSLDVLEGRLGFGHRTVGHSVPWMGSLYLTAQKAKDSGFDLVRRLCDKVGVPDFVEEVLDAFEDLTSWVLNGGLAGAVTHWVGDLPTSGHGGTALQLLAPLMETNTNLHLVLASGPFFNKSALYLGGVLASVSWFVAGSYLVLPKQSVDQIETKVARLIEWITDRTPSQAQLFERAQRFYERVTYWIRKISAMVSTPGPADLPLVSPTDTDGVSSVGLQSEGASSRSKGAPLYKEHKASRRAGTLSLRTESQLSRRRSGISLLTQSSSG